MSNAFTNKPNLDDWVKKQNIKNAQSKNGVRSSTDYSARFNYQLTSKNKNQKPKTKTG